MCDHRPLIPILNRYFLDAIDNPRLQRLKEKISALIYTANWRLGKELCIPDALSRSPVGKPTCEDDVLDGETSFSVRCTTLRVVESLATDVNLGASGQSNDVAMDEFRRVASEEPAFSDLLQCFRASFPRGHYTLPNAVHPYWKQRDNLYSEDDLVLYGARVVVPATLRRRVLASHRGANKWYTSLASNLPGLFESVSADFFNVAGKAFIVIVNRLSGWPVVMSCRPDTTSSAAIRHFRHLFFAS